MAAPTSAGAAAPGCCRWLTPRPTEHTRDPWLTDPFTSSRDSRPCDGVQAVLLSAHSALVGQQSTWGGHVRSRALRWRGSAMSDGHSCVFPPRAPHPAPNPGGTSLLWDVLVNRCPPPGYSSALTRKSQKVKQARRGRWFGGKIAGLRLLRCLFLLTVSSHAVSPRFPVCKVSPRTRVSVCYCCPGKRS